MRRKKGRTRHSGLSIFEVMLVVAIVGLVAALAIPRIGNVKSGSEQVKLSSDVSVLNSAVKVYLANGGAIPQDATADEVSQRVGRARVGKIK